MTKNKIIFLLFFSMHLPITALQKMLFTKNSTPSKTTSYRSSNSSSSPLAPIAQWVSGNPGTALAALGVTGSVGYLLYLQAKKWLTRPPSQPMSLPLLDLPKASKPLVERATFYPPQAVLETPDVPQQIVSSPSLPQQARTIVQQPLAVPVQQPQTLIQPEEKQKKYEENGEFELIQASSNGLKKAIQSHYYSNPSAETVIASYNAGRKVYLKIMSRHAYQLSENDIRNLMWFFYIYAVAHKTNYQFVKEFTFMFIGEHHEIDALYHALTNAAAKYYERMASHYNEYFIAPTLPETWYVPSAWTDYSQKLYTYLFSHRGIDISGLPPRDMGTILFSKLEPNRMYIKPEAHGTANPKDLVLHSQSYLASLSRKNLPKNVLNFMAQYGYMTPDDAAEFRKERVPQNISRKAKIIAEQAETIISDEPYSSIKQINESMHEWGIQAIIPKLADYASSEKIQKQDPQLHQEIVSFFDELTSFYKDWKHRKGNEIVLTMSELLHATQIV